MIHEESWSERLLRALSGEPEPDPRIVNSSVESRALMLAWWLWFVAVVAIIAALVYLSGCAQAPVPPCPVWHGDAVVDDDGDVEAIIVDAENILRLYALVQGLAHGTCRLAVPPIAQKGEQKT